MSKLTPERRRRVPVRQTHLEGEIRERILSCRFGRGTRLPLRTELMREFGASSDTVQQAFHRLRLDGFVESRGKQGTFVAGRLPHEHTYGVVFPLQVSSAYPLYQRMKDQLPSLEARRGIALLTYEQVSADCSRPDWQRLSRDVRHGRLGGLLLACPPGFVDQGALFATAQRPPLVAVMSTPGSDGMPAVWFDYDAFLRLALEAAAGAGRKRVAILNGSFRPDFATQKGFVARTKRLGLAVKPWWTPGLTLKDDLAARSCLRLLLHPDQTTRPNALIVTDDSLIEPAITGILEAGLKVPEDLLLIGQSNFPEGRAGALPVTRIGFDTGRLLDTCLDLLGQQGRGESVPGYSLIPAQREPEHRGTGFQPVSLTKTGWKPVPQ